MATEELARATAIFRSTLDPPKKTQSLVILFRTTKQDRVNLYNINLKVYYTTGGYYYG